MVHVLEYPHGMVLWYLKNPIESAFGGWRPPWNDLMVLGDLMELLYIWYRTWFKNFNHFQQGFFKRISPTI
jgi:hypothetical protein